jgi:RecA/RadA recombinase
MGRPRKDKTTQKTKVSTTRKTIITTKPLKINDEITTVKKPSKLSTDLMKDLLKVSGNEWGGVAAGGIEAGDISGFMDTGSYALNALVSGKLRGGGFPNNKIVVLAGEEATGKTFFVIECIKQFFKDNPTGIVMFFESESAISLDMLVSRGIDANRIVWLPVITVQETRTQAIKILDKYLAMDKSKRIPMMFVLDSLGMLSTTKEITDTEAGKETQDMTRAKLIKSMFRVLTLKLGRAGVPFLVTNHTYMETGMFAKKQMAGGSGTKYSASVTLFLGSSKDKVGEEVVGRIINCQLKKGRITKQDKSVKISLNFDTGLNRYYGLLDIGYNQGVFKHIDKQWKIGKQSAKESAIYDNPEKYFTPEVMDQLEIAAGKEFLYGSSLTKENATI